MSDQVLQHADRRGLAGWMVAVLAAAVATCTAVATTAAVGSRVGLGVAAVAGAGVGILAVIGLPSLSIRLVARVLTGVSGALLVRYGVVAGPLTGAGQPVVVWVVAAAVVLVVTDRIGTDAAPPLRAAGAAGARVAPAALARTAVTVVLVALVAVVLVSPAVLPHVGRAAEPGQGATLGSDEDGAVALRASDSLDMTQRPELTDEVVFTVDSDVGTFWRGETFDVWDGRRWQRSEPRVLPLPRSGAVARSSDDLGALGSDVVTQRIRIEAPFAEVVYAAPSAVQVEIDRLAGQRDDGTVLSAPMGRGTTYTVTSRREPLSAERLRAVDAGATPEDVAARYAQPPVATERVRELADQLSQDATTRYDAIVAIEAWMGERVEYSLDAPLSPEGVDVVDHFLFEAEQGWCEQIASSLVVLARLQGIPARLVTGYVPDERDPVTGTYTVRARNAHAWAEVWFPEVGWVPFDPTADVPLAGEDQAEPTVAGWLADHALAVALVVAAVVLLAGPVRAWLARRLGRRRARPVGWPARTERRLEALGASVDRPRSPDETATSYAVALAQRYRSPELADVGRAVDVATYAPVAPNEADQARLDAVLDRVEAAGAPDREPAGVGASVPG